MKLYVTPLSPYAHMVRIVVREKGLEGRVEIVEARTREPDSPYYDVNPSGRVPWLVRDDGVGMEESALICAYLDGLDGRPTLAPPPGAEGLELGRLEARARSLMDGLTVWGRELRHRPPEERSPRILAHERERSRRLLDLWEREIGSPLMQGPLNMAQITLACALAYASRVLELPWREGRPGLAGWMDGILRRPSLAPIA